MHIDQPHVQLTHCRCELQGAISMQQCYCHCDSMCLYLPTFIMHHSMDKLLRESNLLWEEQYVHSRHSSEDKLIYSKRNILKL